MNTLNMRVYVRTNVLFIVVVFLSCTMAISRLCVGSSMYSWSLLWAVVLLQYVSGQWWKLVHTYVTLFAVTAEFMLSICFCIFLLTPLGRSLPCQSVMQCGKQLVHLCFPPAVTTPSCCVSVDTRYMCSVGHTHHPVCVCRYCVPLLHPYCGRNSHTVTSGVTGHEIVIFVANTFVRM